MRSQRKNLPSVDEGALEEEVDDDRVGEVLPVAAARGGEGERGGPCAKYESVHPGSRGVESVCVRRSTCTLVDVGVRGRGSRATWPGRWWLLTGICGRVGDLCVRPFGIRLREETNAIAPT